MHHHFRDILRDFSDHAPEKLRRMARHRRGHGFAHFVGSIMEEAGFARTGFRPGRKLASDDLQLLLLALIAEKPSHGYDLIKVRELGPTGCWGPRHGNT